jgi:hypothetical protein
MSMFEEEEHPWGAPPELTGTTSSRANVGTSSAKDASLDTLSARQYDDDATNTFSSNADAGFAADPYVASPFARQSSYNGNGMENGFASGLSRADDDDLFGRRGPADNFGSAADMPTGSNPAFGTQRTSSLSGGARSSLNSSVTEDSSAGASAFPTDARTASVGTAAFNSRTFQSYNPSSVLPSHNNPLTKQEGQTGGPAQLTPGYPMPQSFATPAGAYSPFARVDSLNSRKEAAEDMYGVPENFLEVEVRNPMTHGESLTLLGIDKDLTSTASRLRQKDVHRLRDCDQGEFGR